MSKNYAVQVRYVHRSKPSLLITVILLSLIGLLGTFISSILREPELDIKSRPVAAASVAAQSDSNYGLPVSIQIPKLRVEARVIYLGVTRTGDMDIPTNIADTGWYKGSALPGYKGTSVIAGHINGQQGEPAVFSGLSSLVTGDKVIITDSNNRTTVFIVRETRNYNQNEKPEEVFNSMSGTHLNLITCYGAWDSTAHEFAERLVVFTDIAG
jgi:LPXTG-site transpeptidase (sortase) family protein